MANKHLLLVILLTLTKLTMQDISDNKVDNDSPLKEAVSNIMQEQNVQNIGSLVNNLMQGEGAGNLMKNIGSVIEGQGIDPSMLGAVMNLVQNQGDKESGFDFGSFISMFSSFFGEGEEGKGLMDYLPMILKTYNSFMGPEAEAREKDHKNHAWLLPPFIEKLHIMIDHFMNSEMGRNFVAQLGAEKFVRIFHDNQGRFSYPKFVEMLENHSFRKHWIGMVTKRLAKMVAHVADPAIQKKYLSTVQYFINSVLRGQGYPKTALFDPTKPTETLTVLVNHFFQKTFNMQISAKQYVKPAVEYVQDVFRLAQKRGIVGLDSEQLSDKLTDTINMDVIEPIARVNRAYRFATKVQECDRYVMCLVNQEVPDDHSSLSTLKPLLSKGTSLVFSWFLSSQTGTSFWSLYHYITEENNCQALFREPCNGFHLEEIKVTTEYVHNEL